MVTITKNIIDNKNKSYREATDSELEMDSAGELKRKIKFIILHHTQANSTEEAIKTYVDYGVAAHYIIDQEGKINMLVEEKNVAYHAGTSFWSGQDSLNTNSIGIEFLSFDVLTVNAFSAAQMLSGFQLITEIKEKYQIKNRYIIGHSDIAYDSTSGFLDRKQDPSHFFDWKFLAENNLGIFPQISLSKNDDKKLFELGNKDSAIKEIKNKLGKFGYKITNFSDEFDLEMQLLTRVFHRHFNQIKFSSDADYWYSSSSLILDKIILNCQK